MLRLLVNINKQTHISKSFQIKVSYDPVSSICSDSPLSYIYVQKCRQELFNEYFIFDRVVRRFHITSYATEFHVLW